MNQQGYQMFRATNGVSSPHWMSNPPSPCLKTSAKATFHSQETKDSISKETFSEGSYKRIGSREGFIGNRDHLQAASQEVERNHCLANLKMNTSNLSFWGGSTRPSKSGSRIPQKGRDSKSFQANSSQYSSQKLQRLYLEVKTVLSEELEYEEEQRKASKHHKWISANQKEFNNILESFSSFSWEDLTIDELLRIGSEDRLKSQALQEFISRLKKLPTNLEKLVCSHVDLFFDAKLLSFVIIKCLMISKPVVEALKEKVFSDLELFVLDENRSRILQHMCEIDYEFADNLLSLLGDNLGLYRQSINAVFMITGSLKFCNPYSPGFKVFRKALKEDFAEGGNSRYYKKLLVSYVEVCAFQELDEIFEMIFQKRKLLPTTFKDRCLACLLRQFLIRGCKAATKLIFESFSKNIDEYLKNRNFRIFLTKTLKSPTQYELEFLYKIIPLVEKYLRQLHKSVFRFNQPSCSVLSKEQYWHWFFACYFILRPLQFEDHLKRGFFLSEKNQNQVKYRLELVEAVMQLCF